MKTRTSIGQFKKMVNNLEDDDKLEPNNSEDIFYVHTNEKEGEKVSVKFTKGFTFLSKFHWKKKSSQEKSTRQTFKEIKSSKFVLAILR